jgi:hypothetical protein
MQQVYTMPVQNVIFLMLSPVHGMKVMLHQEVKAVFKTTPRQRVVFGDRSVTVFEPVSLIEFNPVN